MTNKKKDFPFFFHNNLTYCDNAATTQKPQAVIDAITNFYSINNAPVHRGIYAHAERATEQYEQARAAVAQFINAKNNEIIFTNGTTESINLAAQAWTTYNLKAGDEIIITELEHHANILPWQQLAQSHGIILRWIPIDTHGNLDFKKYITLLNSKTKLVALTHSSNIFGIPIEVKKYIREARKVGARVLIDAAQTAPRQTINVQELDCDFLVFSGHKMLGPTGIGVLYCKQEVHHELQPYKRGGGMVYSVSQETATWRAMPHMLEAGTPPIASAIALGAAINYLKTIDFTALKKHEAQLCEQLIDGLAQFPQVKILGDIPEIKKSGHMVSFVVDTIHAHDVAAYLDKHNICVRAGNHCAQPLCTKLGIDSSVRISFYLYNNSKDVERIIEVLRQLFGHGDLSIRPNGHSR